MGILSFLRRSDIDDGVEEYRATKGAKLIDVRTREEFSYGHIEGSINVPLQEIERVADIVGDRATPIYVYCRSGSRSGVAESQLKRMGYRNVKNIGGIASYRGKVVR